MNLSSGNVKLFSYFIFLAIFGAVLLQLPWAYVSGDPVPFIDALFTAVSAMCVTGLSTVSMEVYTRLGFCIIMFLIEAGGLGLLTFVSLYLTRPTKKVSLVNRKIIKDYFIEDVDYNPRRILKSILTYTLIIEGIGFLLLMPGLKANGEEAWVFTALFLSVSAFCNAGFAPYTDSMFTYQNNPYVLTVIMLLIVFGGIGFIVMKNISQFVKGKTKHLYLHTRIVLGMTAFLILSGAGLVFFAEYHRSFEGFPLWKKISIAFFQSITTRTAGFEVLPQAGFTPSVTIYDTMLMFIGGGAGSIAGGVKVTTIFVTLLYVLNGNEKRTSFKIGNRQVDGAQVNKAITIVSRSGLLLFISVFLLSITERDAMMAGEIKIMEIIFETVSAFGTVGLTQGITSSLSTLGKVVIILTMFIGRTGIFAMAIHFTKESQENTIQYPRERILLG